MDVLWSVLDVVVHVDRHLMALVREHGAWVYALLFAIVFVETGLVVMPFLPGDSLLIVVGVLCGLGHMDLGASIGLLWSAAVLGNQTNYGIGRAVGARVFGWEQSRWFDRRAFDRAHAFYDRHGGITIVAARFFPLLRTFAPFVAGVARMDHRRFSFFDVTGGGLWVASFTLLGWIVGNIPVLRHRLDIVIWYLTAFPFVVLAVAGLRAWWRRRRKS